MKKTLIAVAAAAALTTSAFAEITFGAWLRVLAAPVASDGDETVTAMGNSWGYGARVARLNVNAVAEDGKAGFDMGIYNDLNDGLSTGDQWSIWTKPVEQVKLSFGKYDNNTLRGDLCYGSWNWLRPTSSWYVEDEGLLMSGNGGKGALIEVTPMEGLYIQALIPIDTTKQKAEDVYKNARGGFAYSIDGIGKIKGQVILNNTPEKAAVAAEKGAFVGTNGVVSNFDAGETLDTGAVVIKEAVKAAAASDAYLDKTFEAEFDLTSVENLWLGVGFQMKMIDKLDDREDQYKTSKMKIALGASYQVNDDLKVSASGAYLTAQKGKDDGGVDGVFQLGAGVDYNLGEGINLAADVRYKSKANDVDNTDSLAFLVGVTKGISSNGYVGVGFQAQTNSGTWANTVIKGEEAKGDKLTWAIPVAMSVWF
ncbi:hypothetical protein [Treponema sp.]|uniref:hypothetical protein n=1 Tax=Treponema sp. TaxID=166 RepID=UPI00298E669D|nr:hypothetical protein [Treponema sp.]